MPRRSEAPKLDIEATPPPETPKKRAKKAEAEPKKPAKRGRKPAIEGFTQVEPFKPSAAAKEAAELYRRREEAKEIAGAPDLTDLAVEEGPSDVDESMSELRKIEAERVKEDEEREWDAKIADARKKAEDDEAVVIEAEEPPAGARPDEFEEAQWDAKVAEAKKRDAFLEGASAYAKKQGETPVSPELRGAVENLEGPKSEAESFSGSERAWFRQGEDETHMKGVAERQEIEELRQGIASYDEGRKEVIIDTREEIDAALKRAEDMVRSGELSDRMFDVRDYGYLLTEQARLDRELETAGWWSARKLRSELKAVQKGLAGYEQQIGSVERERADARDQAKGLPSFPARKVQAREGSGTTLHKEGSGTSIHQDKKPGIFARLFGRK